MKYIFALVLLLALPDTCFARSFALEGTQFDFKASTSVTTFEYYTTVSGGRGELPAPLEGVNVTLFEVRQKNKKIDSSSTDITGGCSFSDLKRSKEYLMIFKKRGFDTKKFKVFIGRYPTYSSFSSGFYIYKKGFWYSRGSSQIFGYVTNRRGNGYAEKGTKIKIEGVNTGYRNSVTTNSPPGYYSFFGLKPDRYKLMADNAQYGYGSPIIEIDLEKDMIYHYNIDASD